LPSTRRNEKIATYTVLHDSSEYELGVDHGNYDIFAYLDDERFTDENGIKGFWEPAPVFKQFH